MRNNIVNKRLEHRIKIIEITIFVNAKAKIYYIAKYMSLIFKLNNCAYLRFNYNYFFSNKSSKKTLS